MAAPVGEVTMLTFWGNNGSIALWRTSNKPSSESAIFNFSKAI
jgi:hypothetical protein